MAYKCGMCNIHHPTRKALVAHMLLVHNSEFLQGDPDFIAESAEIKASKEYADMRKLQSKLFGAGQVPAPGGK